MPRLLESELKNPSFMPSLPSRRPRIKPTQLGQSPHTKIRTALMPCQSRLPLRRASAWTCRSSSVCLDIGKMGASSEGCIIAPPMMMPMMIETDCLVYAMARHGSQQDCSSPVRTVWHPGILFSVCANDR